MMTPANNTSGFYGYDYGTIYPGMGSGMTQTLETVPDAPAQAVMADIENPYVADKKKSIGMLGLFIGLIVLMLVFGYRG